MQETSYQGYVEEDIFIQYIIDGVQDDDHNKRILYNARTIRELKKCFEGYDRVKKRRQRRKAGTKKDKDSAKNATKVRSKQGAKTTDKKDCFTCGSVEHDGSCTDADKGLKCFKCNDYRHIASKCPKTPQQREMSMSAVNCVSSTSDKFIPINIAGSEYYHIVL